MPRLRAVLPKAVKSPGTPVELEAASQDTWPISTGPPSWPEKDRVLRANGWAAPGTTGGVGPYVEAGGLPCRAIWQQRFEAETDSSPYRQRSVGPTSTRPLASWCEACKTTAFLQATCAPPAGPASMRTMSIVPLPKPTSSAPSAPHSRTAVRI